MVAVGTRITPRPTGSPEAVTTPGSHRTARADFPHYALRKKNHSTAISCNFL
jgi:hypothetical protein